MVGLTPAIRQEMARRGITTVELARASGMRLTLLARMLRDDDHNYTVKTLSRLADAMGAELSVDFIDRKEPT